MVACTFAPVVLRSDQIERSCQSWVVFDGGRGSLPRHETTASLTRKQGLGRRRNNNRQPVSLYVGMFEEYNDNVKADHDFDLDCDLKGCGPWSKRNDASAQVKRERHLLLPCGS